MGVIVNQGIKNSVSFYLGMAIGAINTILIYPNVFNNQPEHWGLLTIIVAYATVLSTFSTLGIPQTFIRFFPSVKQKGELFLFSLIVPLIGFLVLCISFFLFKEEFFLLLNAGPDLINNYLYIFILLFFISFYNILNSVSRSYLDSTTPIFLNEVFLKLYSLVILVIHGLKIIDFTTFLKLYILGFIIKFLFLFIIQFFKGNLLFSFSLKSLNFKEMIKYSSYVFVGGASVMLVTRLDMLMIGAMLDLKQLAYYTLAFYIGSAIKVPGKAIVSISMPLLSKAWENQDFKQINEIYKKSSINQFIIGGIIFLCIWINIDIIFNIIPEKFSGGRWVVFYIALAQIFNIASGVNGAIIVNSKYYRFELYTNVLLVVITLLTNYFLIPVFGINGAAMATAISVFLFNFIRLVIIKIKMGIQPFSIKTLYTFVILLLTFKVIIYFPLSGNEYVDVVINILYVLIILIPIIYFLRLSEDINKIIKSFCSRYL